MTNNEAAKWIQLYIDLAKIEPTTGEAAYLNDDNKKTLEAMEMAINALTAQPETHEKRTETHGVCLDTIDRQAALDWLKNEWNGMVTSLFDGIMALPSAQPERKKGKWTDDNACPFCGFQPWYERDIHTLSFCPNCGADMREDENESD